MTDTNVQIILEGMDENNISSILEKLNQILVVKKELATMEDMLRTKVRVYMKERNWDKYQDEDTKLNVEIITYEQKSIDKKKLELLLNEKQMLNITKVKTIEKMRIMSEESKKKVDSFVKRGGFKK